MGSGIPMDGGAALRRPNTQVVAFVGIDVWERDRHRAAIPGPIMELLCAQAFTPKPADDAAAGGAALSDRANQRAVQMVLVSSHMGRPRTTRSRSPARPGPSGAGLRKPRARPIDGPRERMGLPGERTSMMLAPLC
jgi:hypothetical protein